MVVLINDMSSQKLKVAIRVNTEYNLPKKPGAKPAEEEEGGALGESKKPSETTKIIETLEQEKEEKFLKQ